MMEVIHEVTLLMNEVQDIVNIELRQGAEEGMIDGCFQARLGEMPFALGT